MKKGQALPFRLRTPLGLLALVLLAYGRILLDPSLHFACPENDTWNFPVRSSVLEALREGRLPLWEGRLAFGVPWLATWTTETFYPGTLLFTFLGLSAWNLSGLLHLALFSSGVLLFLRSLGIKPFFAFLSASIALLNACAVNHLGSNSPMDTLAWMPWVFLATKERSEGKPWAGVKLSLFLTLQVFAGYPQIILYTGLGCAAFAIFFHGSRSLFLLLAPAGAAFLLSACQWLPSVEYYLLHAVRHPAVADNPHFYLPPGNLKTFLFPNALASGGVPDYVASPTYFFFNLHSGVLPLAALAWGLLRWKRLGPAPRFFLGGSLFLVFWALGSFLRPLEWLGLPVPGILEPAKSWTLLNLFLLTAFGTVLSEFLPKPGRWAGILVLIASLNLLIPTWLRPLERNLMDLGARTEASFIGENLGMGSRVLVLPDKRNHQALYTPLPDPELEPRFKRFVPNSNLLAGVPLANAYLSTWPSHGALNAMRYFRAGFPYDRGGLLDLLGVGILYLPEERMPAKYERLPFDGDWAFWRNPGTLGAHWVFKGEIREGSRQEAFEAFAAGTADPRKVLYVGEKVSNAPRRSLASPGSPRDTVELKKGTATHWVFAQNALPGWRAWVDGEPAPILLADGIFQGIELGPGTGRVRTSYEPASFRLGLFLSLFGLAGLGGFFLFFLRRSPPPERRGRGEVRRSSSG